MMKVSVVTIHFVPNSLVSKKENRSYAYVNFAASRLVLDQVFSKGILV